MNLSNILNSVAGVASSGGAEFLSNATPPVPIDLSGIGSGGGGDSRLMGLLQPTLLAADGSVLWAPAGVASRATGTLVLFGVVLGLIGVGYVAGKYL